MICDSTNVFSQGRAGSELEVRKNLLNVIESLKKRLEVPVCTIDERLSSKEAKRILISKGVKTGHNKSSIDLTAAGIILQEYLDSK